MRKKFVFFFLVPLVALVVVVYIFLDRWVESGLESAGEAVLGAKVEIDNLHVSLSPIAIQFSRLQAASPRDPWKNVFETGTVRFALNFGQLLRAKYIIDLNETFKNRRMAITEQVNRLSTAIGGIDDVARADYDMVRRLARLPDLSTQGLAKLLVGREILGDVERYLSWVDFARTAVPRYTPKPEYEKPERSKGQNISFPSERAYPKLWIKKIAISASEDRGRNPEYFSAHGEVQNITDNQHLTGLPLAVALAGSKVGGSGYTIDASFDRRTDNPVDTYRITTQ